MTKKQDFDENQIEIKFVTLHDLIKGSDSFRVQERGEPLKVTTTIKRLVGQILDEYKKRSGKSHGHFEDNQDEFPVQKYLKEYFIDRTLDFQGATKLMMYNLCHHVKGTASTGGHVFFSHITRNNKDYFIVSIITDELGAAITKNMDVTDNIHLDIKGFRVAGRIDLSSWIDGGTQYLSFIKGRGQRVVSDYFQNFLGCNSRVAAAAATNILIDAIESFSSDICLTAEEKNVFMNKAKDIGYRMSKSDTSFDARVFANELYPQDPEYLLSVLCDPDLKLSEGFVPDARSLKRLVTFYGKTTSWKLEFNRSALTYGLIRFNDDESLTITNLPSELREQLRTETEVAEEDNE
ncbi:nucleoid-associated protein [Aeromonas schubertii]|uniref:Nucleoid-associated protein n=1 Tax=Aeromonas schubertii TaxID=652 RepID=A0ABS7VGI8_9GAMM|nr:nucleoid-associated protein [Aeromonas schubertii]MBZ6068509.1 nucleoid-associated protein [Aeromonas schubertii]